MANDSDDDGCYVHHSDGDDDKDGAVRSRGYIMVTWSAAPLQRDRREAVAPYVMMKHI